MLCKNCVVNANLAVWSLPGFDLRHFLWAKHGGFGWVGRILCLNGTDQSSYSVGVLDFCSLIFLNYFFLVFFLFEEKVICKTSGKSFRSRICQGTSSHMSQKGAFKVLTVPIATHRLKNIHINHLIVKQKFESPHIFFHLWHPSIFEMEKLISTVSFRALLFNPFMGALQRNCSALK